MMQKIGCAFVALLFCLFMGVLGISVGLGAAYPPINQIASPIVCPDGEMVATTRTSQSRSGATRLTARWECVEEKSRTPLSLVPIALISGTVYGLLLFMPVFLIVLIMPARFTQRAGKSAPRADALR